MNGVDKNTCSQNQPLIYFFFSIENIPFKSTLKFRVGLCNAFSFLVKGLCNSLILLFGKNFFHVGIAKWFKTSYPLREGFFFRGIEKVSSKSCSFYQKKAHHHIAKNLREQKVSVFSMALPKVLHKDGLIIPQEGFERESGSSSRMDWASLCKHRFWEWFLVSYY